MSKIEDAINKLSPELQAKHDAALLEGYKDELCPKCEQVFLAHHHFVNCVWAHCGTCPMVLGGAKSVLEQLFPDNQPLNRTEKSAAYP